MKKLLFTALSLLLLSACGPKGPSQEDYDRLAAQYDSLNSQTAELQEIIGAVNSSLDSISTQEGLLFVNNDDGSKPNKKQMLDRISSYKTLLARQQEELARLEELQKKSKGDKKNIAELNNIIRLMREEIIIKEQRIEALETEIATQKRSIAELQQTIMITNTEKQEVTQERDFLQDVAATQDKIINTGYFIVGTKSELKDLGLMKGVFKKKADYANIDKSSFTEIDIRECTSLVINSKKPKLLTEKPAGSYQLIENDDETTTLKITNPTLFWEASPYLIVLTK